MISTFVEYGGFWRRLAASFVDALWVSLLVFFFLDLFYCDNSFILLTINVVTLQENWQNLVLNKTLLALIVLFFWIKYAATPGKLLLDCEIVDATAGQPIHFGQALLRYLAYVISALPLGLGFLWIIWDQRKQGWHDKIAGTLVIIHDEARVPLQQLE